MSWNDDLVANLNDELFWGPKVDNEAIAVTADEGAITLRGTVGSLRQKREAKKAAQRVYGVLSVDNQLQVRLLDSGRRADADLGGDVLRALSLNSVVPQSVDAKVSDGFVTLTGTVDGQFQRDEAEYVALALAIFVGAWALVVGMFEIGLTFRRGEGAGERAMWLLGGIVSVALSLVLFIRPDIGAASLAIVFGLYSVAFGISALVRSAQTKNLSSDAQSKLAAA
jgi:hypothetical protein